MALVRRSLAEDDVDRHNRTCAVPFFLLLSLVTWLLPLSPYLQLQTPGDQPSVTAPVAAPASDTPVTPVVPRFKADCWCPSQFTGAMVAYTNGACAGAFNRALRGENNTGGAGVYRLAMEELIPVGGSDNRDYTFKPNIRRRQNTVKTPEEDVAKKNQQIKEKEEEAEMRQSEWEGIRRFSHVTTPWALFFLGIALWAPYIVIRILTTAFGGVNVDQTLASAEKIKSTCDARGLSLNSRQNAIQTLVWVSQAKGSSSAVLYMLLKVLACVAVLAGLVVVHASLLPRAKEVGQSCAAVKDIPSVVQPSGPPNTEAPSSANDETETFDTPESLSGSQLLCDMTIRRLQNVDQYTVQCIFTLQETPTIQVKSPEVEPSSPQATNTPQACQIYESVFLVAQTYLVVLVVANVVSLLFWLTRLLCRVTGGYGLSLDCALLYHMARDNCSPEIVASMTDGRYEEPIADKDEAIPMTE